MPDDPVTRVESPPPAHIEGDLLFFHPDNDWELGALHDSDGGAYDQDGVTYFTGVVISPIKVSGFNWSYSYDVLCADGVIRRLSEHEIACKAKK
jgi:hypothetical protein